MYITRISHCTTTQSVFNASDLLPSRMNDPATNKEQSNIRYFVSLSDLCIDI